MTREQINKFFSVFVYLVVYHYIPRVINISQGNQYAQGVHSYFFHLFLRNSIQLHVFDIKLFFCMLVNLLHFVCLSFLFTFISLSVFRFQCYKRFSSPINYKFLLISNNHVNRLINQFN